MGRADPRRDAEWFGRRPLGRAVAAVAIEQAEPTMVQHRLLAFAAL